MTKALCFTGFWCLEIYSSSHCIILWVFKVCTCETFPFSSFLDKPFTNFNEIIFVNIFLKIDFHIHVQKCNKTVKDFNA